MSKLEKVLESIANGAEEAEIRRLELDLESVRRLMTALSATNSAEKLTLVHCGLDAEAVELIASSLRSRILSQLCIGYNKAISPRGARALGEMLCVNAALKVVWLYGCNLGDEGAGHLAVALRQNRTLEDLDLDNNCITHSGAAVLAATLPFNQTLKCLLLSENPVGDDGVEALAKAVPCSGLHCLWLLGTEFGERGCAALVEMLKNGSRLQKVRTDEDHWPALEEGFCCNGWLLENAPQQYLERNKAMHEQSRKAVYTLLLIRKLRRTALSWFPKEVVREIAQFVYSSRGELSVWQANKQ
jgi:hypothetical protein